MLSGCRMRNGIRRAEISEDMLEESYIYHFQVLLIVLILKNVAVAQDLLDSLIGDFLVLIVFIAVQSFCVPQAVKGEEEIQCIS